MTLRIAVVLQVEAACVLVTATYAYFAVLHASWGLFLILFLVPDLSLLAYARNPRGPRKALLYNLAHSYVLPFCLLAIGLSTRYVQAAPVALIWFAHIGLDRALGYGLKFGQAFQPTHIQSAGVFLLKTQSPPDEVAGVNKA